MGGERDMISLGDIIKEFDNVDDPDVLERIKTNPALHEALQMKRPQNWWGTGLNPQVLFDIAKDDGIPVVRVPSATVLLDLAAAPSRKARMAVLLLRKQEILDDCKALLSDCDDPWITDACVLTGAAIAAYEAGHHEAAMALAVSVSEPLATWASTPRVQMFRSEAAHEGWEEYLKQNGKSKYGRAALQLSDTRNKFAFPHNWWYQALIAPIPRFFTPWSPESGKPLPDSLSRHVVAHQPTQQHFSLENAMLSLMLATSLLHDSQEWAEEVRSTDGE